MDNHDMKFVRRAPQFDVSPKLRQAIAESIKQSAIVVRHIDLDRDAEGMKVCVDLTAVAQTPVSLAGVGLELTGKLIAREVDGRIMLFLEGELEPDDDSGQGDIVWRNPDGTVKAKW